MSFSGGNSNRLLKFSDCRRSDLLRVLGGPEEVRSTQAQPPSVKEVKEMEEGGSQTPQKNPDKDIDICATPRAYSSLQSLLSEPLNPGNEATLEEEAASCHNPDWHPLTQTLIQKSLPPLKKPKPCPPPPTAYQRYFRSAATSGCFSRFAFVALFLSLFPLLFQRPWN
ncbi:hypothetical protein STEG23_026156 [Scotinomys teguina]